MSEVTKALVAHVHLKSFLKEKLQSWERAGLKILRVPTASISASATITLALNIS